MLSLIKKDFLSHSWMVYVGMVVIILLMSLITLPALFITIICVFSLAFSLFYYDNTWKVNLSLQSMPISKTKIVLSRYLYSICITGIILFFQWMVQWIFVGLFDSYPLTYHVHDFFIFFLFCCMIMLICYPIIYLFSNIYFSMGTIIILLGIGTFYTIDALVHALQMTDEIIFNDLDKGFAIIVESYIQFFPYIVLSIMIVMLLCTSFLLSAYLFKRKSAY